MLRFITHPATICISVTTAFVSTKPSENSFDPYLRRFLNDKLVKKDDNIFENILGVFTTEVVVLGVDKKMKDYIFFKTATIESDTPDKMKFVGIINNWYPLFKLKEEK